MTPSLQVVIPLFPGFTALDGVGPYEILQRLPSVEVTFIAHHRGEVRNDRGSLGMAADATFDEFPRPDVVVLPGGPGTRDLQSDQTVLAWIRQAHTTTRLTTSVCTGSLVLGAAGLLTGLAATTHWACTAELAAHGAVPTPQRVVELPEHRIITSAGVSAGIDMALRLVELLVDRTAAEAVQLMVEYDPRPPFDAGSPATAGAAARSRAAEYRDRRDGSGGPRS
jgi:putative intracellular protease/amidase